MNPVRNKQPELGQAEAEYKIEHLELAEETS